MALYICRDSSTENEETYPYRTSRKDLNVGRLNLLLLLFLKQNVVPQRFRLAAPSSGRTACWIVVASDTYRLYVAREIS